MASPLRPLRAEKCNPCLRNVLLPMSRNGHNRLPNLLPVPFLHCDVNCDVNSAGRSLRERDPTPDADNALLFAHPRVPSLSSPSPGCRLLRILRCRTHGARSTAPSLPASRLRRASRNCLATVVRCPPAALFDGNSQPSRFSPQRTIKMLNMRLLIGTERREARVLPGD